VFCRPLEEIVVPEMNDMYRRLDDKGVAGFHFVVSEMMIRWRRDACASCGILGREVADSDGPGDGVDMQSRCSCLC
jgi:hypothetical protein